MAGPLLGPFAAGGLIIVLVIFMLINREDMRNRLIALIGHGQLTATTHALEEASDRISRYLLMQLILNGAFGIAVSLGLLLIGVPYAPLWGFFAAVLRYIPYLGSWLSALLPIAMSLLVSDSWTQPILIAVLFLALELPINLFVEPWLYGRRTGVSEAALLVAVAFWAWLWGPVGLILASPLTACLVVLGKYVPALSFFNTLLGDRPVLDPPIRYYQRLLARDHDEAVEIAEEQSKNSSVEAVYDQVLVPALN
jgi:predicted PurR-regulated permease PerM